MKSIKKILFLSAFALSSFGGLSAVPEEFPDNFSFDLMRNLGYEWGHEKKQKKIYWLMEMIGKEHQQFFHILCPQLFFEIESLKIDRELGVLCLEENIINYLETIKTAQTADQVRDYLNNIEVIKQGITQLKKELEILNQLQRKYCPDLAALND